MVKTAFDSSYDYVAYDLVKTRLSASQAEAVELNQFQSRRLSFVIGLSFWFSLRPSGSH